MFTDIKAGHGTVVTLRRWIFDGYEVLGDAMTWRDHPSPAVVFIGSMAVRKRATISGKGVATSMTVLRHPVLDLRTGYSAMGRDAVEDGSARWSSRIFTQLVAPLAIAISKGTSRACSLMLGLRGVGVATQQLVLRHV